jgi:hypothetical protein
MDQNRLTGHLEIKGATVPECDQAITQTEQLIAALEWGCAKGRELRAARATRPSAAGAKDDRELLAA